MIRSTRIRPSAPAAPARVGTRTRGPAGHPPATVLVLTLRSSLSLALLLVGAMASAQPPAAPPSQAGPDGPLLSLDRAVAIAIAQNPSLAAADAASRAASETVRESRAARWPTLEVTTDATRSTNPVMVFGQLLSQERFSQANFDVGFLNEPDALDNVRGVVSVSQPLWVGGRIAAGIAGAEHRSSAALGARDRALQELAYRVTDRFTGAVVATQAVAVREESLAAARQNVELARNLFDGGLVVESDLLQARVRESEAESALADARRNADVARAALNLELGRDLDTPYRLPTELALSDRAEPDETDLSTLVARAADQRPDLAAARAQVAAARAGVDGAEGGRFPKIGWSGAYEADSERFFDDPGTNWTVGVGLRWTLFDGFATGARVARSRALLEQAERGVELAERGVALEVESALRGVQTARLRWQEAKRSVDLAKRSVAIVRDRYKEGLTTVVELLQAETLVTGSRVQELRARRELAVARAELRLAVGDPVAPVAAPPAEAMTSEEASSR